MSIALNLCDAFGSTKFFDNQAPFIQSMSLVHSIVAAAIILSNLKEKLLILSFKIKLCTWGRGGAMKKEGHGAGKRHRYGEEKAVHMWTQPECEASWKKIVYLKLKQLTCGEGVGIAAEMLVAIEIGAF